MKVLLIYPNCEGYSRIPIGVAILSSCLKQRGHEVALFDITFMASTNLDHERRERIGTAKKVDTGSHWGNLEQIDIPQALTKKVAVFKPGLIGITLIQNNYWASRDLLSVIRRVSDAHIVAGGTFASVAPEVLLRDRLVDSVIIGEGEEALTELAVALENRSGIDRIDNLVYLNNGEMVRNPIRKYVDLNSVPFQDLSLFDDRHFAKPFDGQMVRAGYFELTRGCPYSCTYCANFFLNENLYKHEKRHIRFKDVEYCIEEIATLSERYHFNFIFFADENLLVLPHNEMVKFASLWKRHVRLPFFVTSRVELATDEKIKLLKEMGCATVAYGIECGNEIFRREMLHRYNTNEQIIKAFELCRKYNIRTTANNMFGFPYETEEQMYETIRLNMAAKPDSFSLCIFAPYLGTQLHEICFREGYIQEKIPPKISMIEESILDMPHLNKNKILEVYSNFMKYYNGELELK